MKIVSLNSFYEDYRKSFTYSKYDRYSGIYILVYATINLLLHIILTLCKINSFGVYLIIMLLGIIVNFIVIYCIFLNTIYKEHKANNIFLDFKNIITKKYANETRKISYDTFTALLQKHNLYSKGKIESLLDNYKFILNQKLQKRGLFETLSLIVALAAGLELSAQVLIGLCGVAIIHFNLKSVINLINNKNEIELIEDLINMAYNVLLTNFIK